MTRLLKVVNFIMSWSTLAALLAIASICFWAVGYVDKSYHITTISMLALILHYVSGGKPTITIKQRETK